MFVEKEVDASIRNSAQGVFLMMANGFGCIIGGFVSGKVVDHLTVAGSPEWSTIWLVFAGYSLVLAVVFMMIFKYKHNNSSTATDSYA